MLCRAARRLRYAAAHAWAHTGARHSGAAHPAGRGGRLPPPQSATAGAGERARLPPLYEIDDSVIGDIEVLRRNIIANPLSDEATRSPAKCIELLKTPAVFLKWSDDPIYRPEMYLFHLDAHYHRLMWTHVSDGKKPKDDEHRVPNSVDVECIKEVRTGRLPTGKADRRVRKYNVNLNLCFSIVCGTALLEVDFVNLIAMTEHVFNVWVVGLRAIAKVAMRARPDPVLTWLKREYLSLLDDGRNHGRHGSIRMSQLVKAFGKDKERELIAILDGLGFRFEKRAWVPESSVSFDIFTSLYNKIYLRDDISSLFANYSKGKRPYLTAEQFKSFLVNEQHVPDVSDGLAHKYIALFESSETLRAQDQISVDGFTKYLLSSYNDVLEPRHMTLHQDMTQPLNHYYINTSHNTYLSGHQLRGESSVEMYIQVLLRNCRCIELDCWDGDDGEPIITHGRTLCTKIKFIDAVRAIEAYAFYNSPYPVILSIENHCSIPQQQKMAQYMIDIFGPRLQRDWLDGKEPERLPSPEDLKYRILIKNKKRPPELGVASASQMSLTDDMPHTESVVGDEDDRAKEAVAIEEVINQDKELRKAVINAGLTVADLKYVQSIAGMNIARELSDLVNYCESHRIKSFDVSLKSDKCYWMLSVPESTAIRYAKNHARNWVRFCMRQLSRIYPNGRRIDSSNMNPQVAWNCGVQMLALNHQTPDVAMNLNYAKFSINGNCGYVLKPLCMRQDVGFDPVRPKPIDGVVALVMIIEVISAQHIFLSRHGGSVCVEVELIGLPHECKRYKTEPCTSFVLKWSNEFRFRVHLPEISLLRFAVVDQVLGIVGQCVLHVGSIRPGYRHVPLRTIRDEKLHLCSLFVRFRFEDYVPEEHLDFTAALIAGASNDKGVTG